jgi:hypothetical protein
MNDRHAFSVLLVAWLVVAAPAHAVGADEANAADPCDLADSDMFLKKSWLDRGRHFGLFEIRVRSFIPPNSSTTFSGRRDRQGFHVDQPAASFEFRDANGTWHWLLQPIVDFDAPPDRLAIPFLGRGEVIAELPNLNVAERAAEWRLVLRSHDSSECKRSAAFRPVQYRGPIRKFASIKKAPRWDGATPTTTSCPCSSQDASHSQAK